MAPASTPVAGGGFTNVGATTTSTPSEHAATAAVGVDNNNSGRNNQHPNRTRNDTAPVTSDTKISGPRIIKKADRILITGKADLDRCDNQVISARYTIYSFFPLVRWCKI
jgi:hypothetical protein